MLFKNIILQWLIQFCLPPGSTPMTHFIKTKNFSCKYACGLLNGLDVINIYSKSKRIRVKQEI